MVNLDEFETWRKEFEKLADDFINRIMKTNNDKKRLAHMEKLQINLFEGTFDLHGNYTPGKFELLTMPEYYEMVDTPP